MTTHGNLFRRLISGLHPGFALCFLLLTFPGVMIPAQVLASDNVALVIGNSNYKHSRLINPANDARAVAAKFAGMGYDVMLALDVDRDKMEAAIDNFSIKASSAAKAVVYYAGHGVQINGRNYLVPLNVKLDSRRDLRKLTELSELTDEVMQASRLGVVIVDACRDNPFAVDLGKIVGRSVARAGLGRTQITGGNTLIAYATEADAIAYDGAGKHSPYTNSLLKFLDAPELDILQLFGKVRDDVISTTKRQQRPYVYQTLGGDKYFLSNSRQDKALEQTSKATGGRELELTIWNSAERGGTLAEYRSYLERYPEGVFVTSANSRIKALTTLTSTGDVPRRKIVSDQTRNISAQDIQLVSKKFNDLKVALTKGQWDELLTLSGVSARSRKLLVNLKNLKQSYHMEVRDVYARRQDQSVYASLHITEVDNDGEKILRAANQKTVIPLSSTRIENVWSEVVW